MNLMRLTSTTSQCRSTAWPVGLFFGWFLLFTDPAIVLAVQESTSDPRQHISKNWEDADALTDLSMGHDCGVYCLSVIASNYGRPFDVKKFLDSPGGIAPIGMSIADLNSAIHGIGLVPISVRNMNIAALEQSEYPSILNFDPLNDQGLSGHWVVCLGIQGEGFQIFDTSRPGKVITMLPGELQGRWNGVAIAVADRPDWFFGLKMSLTSMASIFPYLLIGIAGGLAAQKFRPRAVMALAAIMSMLGWAYWVDPNSLWNSQGVARFRASYDSPCSVAELPLAGMIDALKNKTHRVVDARLSAGFRRCHLRDSVNLPIDSDLSQMQEVSGNWDRNQKIIVMCQSLRCGWAEEIAKMLVEFGGFKEVSIFRGGIQALQDLQACPDEFVTNGG